MQGRAVGQRIFCSQIGKTFIFLINDSAITGYQYTAIESASQKRAVKKIVELPVIVPELIFAEYGRCGRIILQGVVDIFLAG